MFQNKYKNGLHFLISFPFAAKDRLQCGGGHCPGGGGGEQEAKPGPARPRVQTADRDQMRRVRGPHGGQGPF